MYLSSIGIAWLVFAVTSYLVEISLQMIRKLLINSLLLLNDFCKAYSMLDVSVLFLPVFDSWSYRDNELANDLIDALNSSSLFILYFNVSDSSKITFAKINVGLIANLPDIWSIRFFRWLLINGNALSRIFPHSTLCNSPEYRKAVLLKTALIADSVFKGVMGGE